MASSLAPSGGAQEWLERFRLARERIQREAASLSPARRREGQGRGAGGDITVLIDRVAEDAVLDALEPTGIGILSEEIGLRAGTDSALAVIDPIDGSLNAKRGMPGFSTSIALADGPAMTDVWLGWVFDYGSGEEWVAERGRGAWVDGEPILPDEAGAGPLLDLVALEGATPVRVGRAMPAMEGHVNRIRVLGSAALSMCQAAAGRVDAMAALGAVRAVDVAASVLIAGEAGVIVGLPEPEDVPRAQLDVESRWPAVVGRTGQEFDIARAALAAARDEPLYP
jgi:myo-inositol-1(or 4)-monophosphatase